MLLTIDIGNTSIKLGVFEDNALLEEFRLASDKELSQDEYEVLLRTLFKSYKISGCILGSVVEELNEKITRAVRNVFNTEPLVLNSDTETGLKIKLKNPKEAGADRIANACAAYVNYSKPCIVIDFGTAISFDIVNSGGEFIGGVIAPGLKLQMNALNKFTSKLPKIDVAISPSAIGDNTTDAILSGVIRGTACMIDGLVKQCEKELGEKAIIVATGGYSGLISNYLEKPFDFINPTLTLEGLRILYNLNTVIAKC
ncbi:type III pantothenate kinase [bacterium]|nr:type III pantothenate kinase [bacterium]